jgi:hypothetical protein
MLRIDRIDCQPYARAALYYFKANKAKIKRREEEKEATTRLATESRVNSHFLALLIGFIWLRMGTCDVLANKIMKLRIP